MDDPFVTVPGYPGIRIHESGKVDYLLPVPNELVLTESSITIPINGMTVTSDPKFLYKFILFRYPDYVHPSNVEFYLLPYRLRGCDTNWHAKFKTPVELPGGFRLCAARPQLAVTRDGNEILDVVSGRIRKSSSKSGYRVIAVHNPMLRRTSLYPVHRLVANAWVDENQTVFNPEVNHLDGNKQNNCAENLEWTTHSGNTYHLHHTGLGSTIKACRVLNIETQEITEFSNSTEAARYVGISEKQLQSHQHLRSNTLIADKWEFRYSDDPRPWVYFGDFELESTGSSRYLITVTEDNGTVRKFNGVIPFKVHYHIWKLHGTGRAAATMADALKQFKKAFPQHRIEVLDRKPIKEIQVKNRFTGVVKTYRTAKEAAPILGISPGVLYRFLRYGKPHVWRQFIIRTASNEPWGEATLTENSLLVWIAHRDSPNDKKYFLSQEKVAEYLGVVRPTVGQAIRRGYFSELPYLAGVEDRYDAIGDRADRLISQNDQADCSDKSRN